MSLFVRNNAVIVRARPGSQMLTRQQSVLPPALRNINTRLFVNYVVNHIVISGAGGQSCLSKFSIRDSYNVMVVQNLRSLKKLSINRYFVSGISQIELMSGNESNKQA